MSLVRDLHRWIKKRLVARLVSPASQRPMPYPPARIGILSWERWGDAILLTSLVRGLHQGFPQAELTVFTFSDASKQFFHQFCQEYSWVQYRFYEQLTQLRTSELPPFDWLISTKDHFSATFALALEFIPHQYRIGFAHPDYARYLHLPVVTPYEMPIIEKYRSLLQRVGVTTSDESLRPVIPLQSVRPAIWQWIAQHRNDRPIGINLSAGHPDRCLTEAQVRAIIEHVAPHPVILFAVGAQQSIVPALARHYPSVLLPPSPASIFEAAALLQATALLISPDTALVHAASAMRTPVVVLYLNQHRFAERFAPYRVPYRRLITNGATIATIATSSLFRAIEALWAAQNEA